MAETSESVKRVVILRDNHTPVSSLLDEMRKRLGIKKKSKNDARFATHAASMNSVVSCEAALLAAAMDPRFLKDPEAMRVFRLLTD